jgi:periplasmic protein TonB
MAVIAVHGGVVWGALNWKRAEAAPGGLPPAVMIELTPLAIAPMATPDEAAPGPQMTEAHSEAMPDAPPEKTVEDAKPDTPPPPVTSEERARADLPPVAAPEPAVEAPELPRQERADATLAPAPAAPPLAQKKPPSPKKREVERLKLARPDKQQVRRTTAPPTSDAQRANTAAAPSAAPSSAISISPASWKSELMAHLSRYKHYPQGASVGTASVAFGVNRSGDVLFARLIGSSGDSALDEEAVALVRRASPVPAPPSGFGGGSITLTVPIRFNH